MTISIELLRMVQGRYTRISKRDGEYEVWLKSRRQAFLVANEPSLESAVATRLALATALTAMLMEIINREQARRKRWLGDGGNGDKYEARAKQGGRDRPA